MVKVHVILDLREAQIDVRLHPWHLFQCLTIVTLLVQILVIIGYRRIRRHIRACKNKSGTVEVRVDRRVTAVRRVVGSFYESWRDPAFRNWGVIIQ